MAESDTAASLVGLRVRVAELEAQRRRETAGEMRGSGRRRECVRAVLGAARGHRAVLSTLESAVVQLLAARARVAASFATLSTGRGEERKAQAIDTPCVLAECPLVHTESHDYREVRAASLSASPEDLAETRKRVAED